MQTLDAFDKKFPTEEACRDYLVSKRWPTGVQCPRCNATERVYALKARPYHWVCKNTECGGRSGYRFSVITRTIFQDTKVPLKVWFKVGYLMLTAKKGISALQVHRVIFGDESGSDWRTSWYMCHRWRAAMRGDVLPPLTGEIEVDETYIGGKSKNRHVSKRHGKKGFPYKVPVVGAIARKGNVVCKAITRASAVELTGFVNKVVDKEHVELIATDENPAYSRLTLKHGLPHQTVNHSHQEYVRGSSTPRTSTRSGRCSSAASLDRSTTSPRSISRCTSTSSRIGITTGKIPRCSRT